MVSKERVQGKLKDLVDKHNHLVKEVQSVEQEMVSYQELLLQMDDKFVKIKCPQCDGLGYIQEDKGKVICRMCGGKCYVWMEKFDKK